MNAAKNTFKPFPSDEDEQAELNSYLDCSPTARALYDRYDDSLPYRVAEKFIERHSVSFDRFLNDSGLEADFYGSISLVSVLVYLGY